MESESTAKPTSALKLEVGKTYKTGFGGNVKIIATKNSEDFPFLGSNNFAYTEEGSFWGCGRTSAFDLVEEVVAIPSPIRTITRKELVPGTYGNVHVSSQGWIHTDCTRDPQKVRQIANTLLEIADALENGDETTS